MGQKFKKPNVHGESFSSFMKEFTGESDRAAVILGAAQIESLLGNLLDKFLLPCTGTTDDLLEGDAPLATFSAKIKMCHRLGLIDDNFVKLLNTFRRLRNGFAHEAATGSLSTGSARDRVAALAEPFLEYRFFQSLVAKIAANAGREVNDPGMVFRAVLGIFHIELIRLHSALTPMKPSHGLGIVEQYRAAIPPDDREKPEDLDEA